MIISVSQGIVLQDSGFPRLLTVLATVRMWAATLTAPLPPVRQVL